MKPNGTVFPHVTRIRNIAAVVGLAGVGLSLLLLLTTSNAHDTTDQLMRSSRHLFNRAYLFSFVFVLGLSMGSMALLMVHRQLGGAWGFLVRRPLEASCLTVPLVAVLLAPILYDLEGYYPWIDHPPGQHDTASHADAHLKGEGAPGAGTEHAPKGDPTPGHPTTNTAVHNGDLPKGSGDPVKVATGGESPESLGLAQDRIEQNTEELFAFKRWWLTPRHFAVRMAIYFAIWTVMALILNIGSRRQDEIATRGDTARAMNLGYGLQSFSAPGIVIYFLSMTLALVDLVMSLEPDWYSSLFGVMLMIGQGLSTICLMILVTVIISRRGETDGLDTRETFNDLGNLMLAFTMLWGYLSFSQFLIIWSGNLAEEIPWYERRLSYGWLHVGQYLMALHFFLPFTILLCRPLKRNLDALKWVAGLMLVSRLVDVYWQVTPSFNYDGPRRFLESASLFDLTVPAGVLGLWFAAYLTLLRGKPLMVVQDPELLPALKQAGGH